MGGQRTDSHWASNPSSQEAHLHALGGGCQGHQNQLGGQGPPPETEEVHQMLQDGALLPKLSPQSCLPAKTLNRGW